MPVYLPEIMSITELILTDRHSRRLGKILVEGTSGAQYLGKFLPDEHGWTTDLKQLFDEHDNLINDQIFSLLDEIESRIEACGLCVVQPETSRCFLVANMHVTANNELSIRLGAETECTSKGWL